MCCDREPQKQNTHVVTMSHIVFLFVGRLGKQIKSTPERLAFFIVVNYTYPYPPRKKAERRRKNTLHARTHARIHSFHSILSVILCWMYTLYLFCFHVIINFAKVLISACNFSYMYFSGIASHWTIVLIKTNQIWLWWIKIKKTISKNEMKWAESLICMMTP